MFHRVVLWLPAFPLRLCVLCAFLETFTLFDMELVASQGIWPGFADERSGALDILFVSLLTEFDIAVPFVSMA